MSKFYEELANREKVIVGYQHRIPSGPGLKPKLMAFGMICEIMLMLWLNIRIDYIWKKGYLKEHWLYWGTWFTVCLTVTVGFWFCPWSLLSTETAIGLFLLAWFNYYILLSLFFRKRVFEYLWKKVGRAKTIMVYEPMLATIFLGFLVGYGALVEATAGRGFSIHQAIGSPIAIQMICVLLWAIGYVFKTWATWLIGMDAFFFRDQILRTPNERLVRSKIYHYFSHPTYGIGYVGVYAYALSRDTLYGLAGGLFLHCGIFLFLKLAEEPGMREIYGGDEA